MKKTLTKIGLPLVAGLLLLAACTPPITMTSWKNPNASDKVTRVVVMCMFNKLEYIKPYEQAVTTYFTQQGLKSIMSLTFLVPFQKYEVGQIQAKLDSLGADAILIFTYKGSDVSQNYTPPTYYGFYSGGWGWGGWGGAAVAGSPGYWSTSTTVNVRANLYSSKSQALLWTADFSYDNPSDPYASGTQAAQSLFPDWQKDAIVNIPAPQKK
jgi:hypothetical protein